nr:hypothetical protein [uncultured Desulfobacter sp.]
MKRVRTQEQSGPAQKQDQKAPEKKDLGHKNQHVPKKMDQKAKGLENQGPKEDDKGGGSKGHGSPRMIMAPDYSKKGAPDQKFNPAVTFSNLVADRETNRMLAASQIRIDQGQIYNQNLSLVQKNKDLSALENIREKLVANMVHYNLHGNKAVKHTKSTQTEYTRVAKRQRPVPLADFPKHISNRRNELKGRAAWWKEHAVARKTLGAAALYAQRNNMPGQLKYLQEIDKQMQELKWGTSERQVKPQFKPQGQYQPQKEKLNEKTHQRLLQACQKKQDQELYDTLVISRCTGCRPEELRQGIDIKQSGDVTRFSFNTAKKSDGNKGGNAMQRAAKGVDREVFIRGDAQAKALAERYQFEQFIIARESDVQSRLQRLRMNVEGAERISLYTYRNNFAAQLREQGKTRTEIAEAMGHQGERSQDSYGVYE